MDTSFGTITNEVWIGPGIGEGRYAQNQGNLKPFEAKTGNEQQSYHLLPNPNSGNFSLRQSVADEKPVQAEIWNGLGAKVYAGRLNFTGKLATVKMNSVASGNYLLKLRDNNGKQYIIKFTVL